MRTTYTYAVVAASGATTAGDAHVAVAITTIERRALADIL